jgi:hypothetical protein
MMVTYTDSPRDNSPTNASRPQTISCVVSYGYGIKRDMLVYNGFSHCSEPPITCPLISRFENRPRAPSSSYVAEAPTISVFMLLPRLPTVSPTAAIGCVIVASTSDMTCFPID